MFIPHATAILLERIAANADQPLVTVESWAAQLGSEPEVQLFVAQLQQEWLPFWIPNELCHEMMDYARHHLGWYQGWIPLWAHILRVTATVLTLAPEADVEREHAFMLGLFHDIGKLDEMNGGASHESSGAQIARQRLTGRYDSSAVDLISRVIGKKASPSHPYARLLHDADKLDKIGATGVLRRLTTDYGVLNPLAALRRVHMDVESFPPMHFPTSRQMGESKQHFTREFLARFRGIPE